MKTLLVILVCGINTLLPVDCKVFSVGGKRCHPLIQRSNLKQRGSAFVFLERNTNRWLKSFFQYSVHQDVWPSKTSLWAVPDTPHYEPPKVGKRTAVLNQIKYIPRLSSLSLTAKQHTMLYKQSRRKGSVSFPDSFLSWLVHLDHCV